MTQINASANTNPTDVKGWHHFNPNDRRVNYYAEYVAEGHWKCDKSPSGAHVWRFETNYDATCKHCGVSRNFKCLTIDKSKVSYWLDKDSTRIRKTIPKKKVLSESNMKTVPEPGVA